MIFRSKILQVKKLRGKYLRTSFKLVCYVAVFCPVNNLPTPELSLNKEVINTFHWHNKYTMYCLAISLESISLLLCYFLSVHFRQQ